MDGRGQIFSEFQNFTGIDDAGRCFTILEQFNWNLQDAVQSTLMDSSVDFMTDSPILLPFFATPPLLNTTPPSINNPSTAILINDDDDDDVTEACIEVPIGSSSTLHILKMHVEYRTQTKSLVMRDTDSVGHLKELLAEAFKLPFAHLELHGWVHKNDHLIRDTDLLKNLNLPKDNYLYILTPKLPVTTPHQSNGTSKEEALFKVTVKHLDEQKEVSLRFPPDKTIQQLKQHVGYCLSVPVHLQLWQGIAPEVNFDDKTTLRESGLARCVVLELRCNKTQAVPELAAKNTPSEADSDSDQGDLEVFGDEDLEEEDHSSFRSVLQPLMPANSTDQTTATESFCREFGLRYGELHPIFYIGSLDNAVKDSINCKAKDRKMLAIYLHHDNSASTHVFCSQVLCADSLISYLSANFICWPWDLTSPSNADILIQTCSSHFGTAVSTSISHRTNSSPDHLPVLLILARHRGNNEVIELIEGNCNLSETISRLIHASEMNSRQLEGEVAEEAEREARERVLAEQDAAYQESLALDRAKEDSRKREVEERERVMRMQEREKEESMSKQLKEEEERQALRQILADSLPDEPPLDSSKAVISIKVRCPDGQTLNRRFYRHDHLSDLLNFITSQGRHTGDFKLLTVYPRRDLKQQDPTKTFEDLGLASQESVTLEEL